MPNVTPRLNRNLILMYNEFPIHGEVLLKRWNDYFHRFKLQV